MDPLPLVKYIIHATSLIPWSFGDALPPALRMSYKYAHYGRATEREGRKSAKLTLRFRCHGSFPTPIAATPPPYQLPGLGKQRYKNGRISVSTRGACGWVNKSVVSGRKIFSAETLGRERWNTRLSIQFLLGTLLSFGRSLGGGTREPD